MESYCSQNNLKVNESKTKIMVFSKGKIRKLSTLKLNNTELEVVFSYTFLGIIINYNGKFTVAQKDVWPTFQM